MAFIRTKTINGRPYRYLVETERDGDGSVRQRFIKYLGPEKPVYQSANRPKKK